MNTNANKISEDSIEYWINADKETIQKHLKDNIQDVDAYREKVNNILSEISKKTKITRI